MVTSYNSTTGGGEREVVMETPELENRVIRAPGFLLKRLVVKESLRHRLLSETIVVSLTSLCCYAINECEHTFKPVALSKGPFFPFVQA